MALNENPTLNEIVDEVERLNNLIIDRGGAQTITPTTTNKVLNKGHYKGNITIKGDANLNPRNIINGVTIFGVTGVRNSGAQDKKIITSSTNLTTVIMNMSSPSSQGLTSNSLGVTTYNYESWTNNTYPMDGYATITLKFYATVGSDSNPSVYFGTATGRNSTSYGTSNGSVRKISNGTYTITLNASSLTGNQYFYIRTAYVKISSVSLEMVGK